MQAPQSSKRSIGLLGVSFLLLAGGCAEGSIDDAEVGRSPGSQTEDSGTKAPDAMKGVAVTKEDAGAPSDPAVNPTPDPLGGGSPKNTEDAAPAPEASAPVSTPAVDAGNGNASTTGAWRPFNDASPWNTPISDAAA